MRKNRENKLINFINYNIISAIKYKDNYRLCKKYPFLKMKNVWTGKFHGYSSTWLDALEPGWRIALGKDLVEELANELKAEHIKKKNWEKSIFFSDIKEKYGTLRLYAVVASGKLQKILSKYELLSMGYCSHCGKPARYVTDGWISYLCEDCNKGLDGVRLSKDDLPVITKYINNKPKKVSIKEEYNVDLLKLWGCTDDKKDK